ncbi:hypothetical protein E2C01_006383 [Portunus trituberculatus]|uniref:Uncharacterized protein n=1 Tax=Portunus trituberculatus TaxID=210409 RepID=A0A5B7D1P3_PORTR|nr:hypothetical protein [Portunus trituberculatus]
MRIEKVGENRKEAPVRCLRQLCLDEIKKMRFSRGEVIFYRLKIRSQTANDAEVNEEKVEGGVKTFLGRYLRSSPTWKLYGPLP